MSIAAKYNLPKVQAMWKAHRTKKDASLNQINSKLKRALAQSAGKYNYKAD